MTKRSKHVKKDKRAVKMNKMLLKKSKNMSNNYCQGLLLHKLTQRKIYKYLLCLS